MTKSRPPDRAAEEAAGRAPSRGESALWRQVTGDVAPLAKRPRPARPPAPPEPQPNTQTTPQTPAHAAPNRGAGATPGVSPPRMPEAAPKPAAEPPMTDGAAPGLDKRTKMRLKRGQVEIQGVMDLHGHTQVEAHRALIGFVEGAQRAGRRCVLVITGKGAGGAGVLRAAVPRWLNEAPLTGMVRAFSGAQPKDGGGGALYILLRRRR